jgi:hypothetical protein
VKPRKYFVQNFLSLAVKLGGEDAPVVLAFGWAIEFTRSEPTISSVTPRIGIIFVACCAARIATSPPAEMTSTRAWTSSAAYSEIRSTCGPKRGNRL